jgi:DNA invertase Pin-like site-specific DNA recombinase
MSNVTHMARPRPRVGIAGLFWLLPAREQADRIRELKRSGMSAETVATITRLPVSEVRRLAGGAR